MEKLLENGLTIRRKRFVDNYVSGYSQTDAAKSAGFADPKGEGYRLMQEPVIQAAIQTELVKRVQCEGMSVAVNFLINCVKDEKFTGSVRIEAAKVLINKGPLNDAAIKDAYKPADKPLNEMSLSELEAFIQGGVAALDKAKQAKALPVEFIEVPSDNAQQSTDTDPK